jgi:hypothetical protein
MLQEQDRSGADERKPAAPGLPAGTTRPGRGRKSRERAGQPPSGPGPGDAARRRSDPGGGDPFDEGERSDRASGRPVQLEPGEDRSAR